MVTGINHITISVRDLKQSFNFYSEILGFKPLAFRKNKSAYLLAGNDWIALVESQKACADNASYAHLAFSVASAKFKEMSDRILASGTGRWQDNSSPGESLYFLDPSGNKLEIHVGDWKTRIQWLRDNPSPDVELYV